MGGQRCTRVTDEDIAFDKNLIIAPAVNSLEQVVLEEVVEDVLMTETASRSPSPTIPPEVVVVGNMKMASIDVPQRVTITNQRTLPVVVKVVPRDSDPIRSADNV